MAKLEIDGRPTQHAALSDPSDGLSFFDLLTHPNRWNGPVSIERVKAFPMIQHQKISVPPQPVGRHHHPAADRLDGFAQFGRQRDARVHGETDWISESDRTG
jgi:hypothetical protein